MIFESFEELQNVCGDCILSNEGIVCWNTHNPTYLQGKSWGDCTLENCPVVEHKVKGSLYINGEKIGDITAIEYS